MKRILCLILALFLLMPCVLPAMAVEDEPTVTPRYTYIARIGVKFEIGSLGFTACQADCYAENGGWVELSAKLQQYNGSSWITLKTWTATDDNIVSISKNYPVPQGYTYRLRANCAVYSTSGVLLESGTCYSNQVTY